MEKLELNLFTRELKDNFTSKGIEQLFNHFSWLHECDCISDINFSDIRKNYIEFNSLASFNKVYKTAYTSIDEMENNTSFFVVNFDNNTSFLIVKNASFFDSKF